MSDLVGNPDCWFSHAMAQFYLVFYIIFTKEACSYDLSKSINPTIIIIRSVKPLNRQIKQLTYALDFIWQENGSYANYCLFVCIEVKQLLSQVGKVSLFPRH